MTLISKLNCSQKSCRGGCCKIEEMSEVVNGNSSDGNTDNNSIDISEHERVLISNILKLRNMTVSDVMVPRADIVSIDVNSSKQDLTKLFSEKQLSRIPVYSKSLDDVLGIVHMKDVFPLLASGDSFKISDVVRTVPFVSPAMPLLDLLLDMRQSGKHMVFVVDEYGGIDGIASVGDVIEAVVGELYDEFDSEVHPEITVSADGSILADARVDISEFEKRFGVLFSDEEREYTDTLGGVVFNMAGRIPARGEVITHDSGIVFEITDADPRRINRIKITGIESKDN